MNVPETQVDVNRTASTAEEVSRVLVLQDINWILTEEPAVVII
jgi:hypothetical protein